MEVDSISTRSSKSGKKWEEYQAASSIFRGVSEDYLLRDNFWVGVVYKELFALQEENEEEGGMISAPESVSFFLFFVLFLFFFWCFGLFSLWFIFFFDFIIILFSNFPSFF